MTVVDMKNAYNTVNGHLSEVIKEGISRYGVPTSNSQALELARKLYPAVNDARSNIRGVTLIEAAGNMNDIGFEFSPARARNYEVDAVYQAICRVAGLSDNSFPVSKSHLDDISRVQSSVALHQVVKHNEDLANEIMIQRLSASLSRHAYAAGRQAIRDTVLYGSARNKNSRKQTKLAYARVLTGAENCAFCAMLASRGAVYSKKNVIIAKDGDKYHDNCDCVARLVVPGRSWEGQDEAERLSQLWADTATRSEFKAFAKNWRKEKDKTIYTPIRAAKSSLVL